MHMDVTKNGEGGEHIRLGQMEVVFLAQSADTDGHMDLFELRVAPGARVPGAHHHVDMDEVIYGLEGVMTYVVGDRVHEVHPGERVFSPRGIVHYFVNRGQAPARALLCGTPARLGPEYFREIAALLSAGGPPDMQRVAGVMRRYGLEPQALPASVQL
jgi:quercetin dioxygenase-like cupin family protein